jgi:outer membrane protein assembly factor BamB
MGPTDVPRPPSRFRSFLRYGLPLLIVILTAGAIALLQLWPSEEVALVYRNAFGIMIGMLGLFLLLVWLLAFSGLRWWLRLAIPVALAASVWAVVGDVSCTGDMLPLVRPRWQPSALAAIEAYHRSHPDATGAGPADLSAAPSTDFPGYRGTNRDGVASGPALRRSWAEPPKPLWKHPVGGGYAAFAVAGDSAVTIEQRGPQEAVVCYERDTGKERWTYAYDADFRELMGGPGPRATPTIDGGYVFALGANGHLTCLTGSDGTKEWQVNILDGNENIRWAMSGSPLVYDDVVVVNPGAQRAGKKALVAYNRKTGAEVWGAGGKRAGYSSPMLATLAGRRQVLLFDADGLAGYDADGKDGELWRFPWRSTAGDQPTQEGINVAQPLVLDGDRVFISAAYGMGSAMLHVTRDGDKWAIKELWRKKTTMQSRFSNPVAYQGHIYGLDEGILACIDEDGKPKWKGERYGHGQVLLAGDVLVVLAEDGELALVEATPERFRALGRFPALAGHTWNYPALADGKAYVRNDREMACYDLAR